MNRELVYEHPYTSYGINEWSLYYISLYSGIDGEHHKAWVLDQVARILHGSTVNVYKRICNDGSIAYDPCIDVASEEYHNWVKRICEMPLDTLEEDYEENGYYIGCSP